MGGRKKFGTLTVRPTHKAIRRDKGRMGGGREEKSARSDEERGEGGREQRAKAYLYGHFFAVADDEDPKEELEGY